MVKILVGYIFFCFIFIISIILFLFVGVVLPWRWSRTHRSSGALGCDACPHSRVFESRATRVGAAVGRQPNSVPFVLGGPRRSADPVPVGACMYPGSCRAHVGSLRASLGAFRMLRVRGNPPSGFIPRPYVSTTGRRSSLFSPSIPATHDALVLLLGDVMTVFNAYEACLGELDAWRRFFCSGR